MQEDVERRTVAIVVSASRLTSRVLARACMAVLHQLKKECKEAKTPQGKQSVKKLMNHGVATSGIPLDGNTKLFDRFARKCGVDYAFHKTGPGKHVLFFKAGQADAITTCLAEYTQCVTRKRRNARPSISSQLEQANERVRARPRERERVQEVERDR